MITDTERVELGQVRKRARGNRAVAFRARVVLACADTPDNAVARRLRTTKTTVAKWRHRFVDLRLARLYDEPRVGAPRTVSDAAIEAVIVKTLETTPPGETHWSTRTMARAAGHLADVPAAAAPARSRSSWRPIRSWSQRSAMSWGCL